jgi:hypothetical protein
MKYALLIYVEPDQADILSAAALGFQSDLQSDTRISASNLLHKPSSATTIRLRAGQITITDGAQAKTTEHLSEFHVIETRDLNDAIRIAGSLPQARLGTVELRPIIECNPSERP